MTEEIDKRRIISIDFGNIEKASTCAALAALAQETGAVGDGFGEPIAEVPA